MNAAKYDMKINYHNEYADLIHSVNSDMAPSVGQAVIFEDEEYRVKNVIWMIERDYIIVELTQSMVKSTQKESTDSGRLNQINNAILAVNKRQDASEKKGRALNEQIGSVRKHINQRIQQEKKDTQ